MSKIRKYILLIIDMQPFFDAVNNNRILISNIVNEIKRAKQLHNQIMFVTYNGCGPIASALVNAVRNFEKVQFVTKDKTSGGTEVLFAIKKRKNLRVCGVETDVCVKHTVTDIAKKYPQKYKIQLVKRCLANSQIEYVKSEYTLQNLERRFRNIEVDWT